VRVLGRGGCLGAGGRTGRAGVDFAPLGSVPGGGIDGGTGVGGGKGRLSPPAGDAGARRRRTGGKNQFGSVRWEKGLPVWYDGRTGFFCGKTAGKGKIGRASCRERGWRSGGGGAEDGIRDFHVTGVQTCALPI